MKCLICGSEMRRYSMEYQNFDNIWREYEATWECVNCGSEYKKNMWIGKTFYESRMCTGIKEQKIIINEKDKRIVTHT